MDISSTDHSYVRGNEMGQFVNYLTQKHQHNDDSLCFPCGKGRPDDVVQIVDDVADEQESTLANVRFRERPDRRVSETKERKNITELLTTFTACALIPSLVFNITFVENLEVNFFDAQFWGLLIALTVPVAINAGLHARQSASRNDQAGLAS